MASSILETIGVFLILVGLITGILDWAIEHGWTEVPRPTEILFKTIFGDEGVAE